MPATETVNELKCAMYDVIEEQAIAQARFNELEKVKADLAKKLGEARQQEAAEKQERPAIPVRANRPHTRDDD